MKQGNNSELVLFTINTRLKEVLTAKLNAGNV